MRDPGPPPRQVPLKSFEAGPENKVYDYITSDHDWVLGTFGEDKLWAPEFELGDGLVFTQDVIHRTYVTPAMTKPRIGFGFRAFSARHIACGLSPADLSGGVEQVA